MASFGKCQCILPRSLGGGLGLGGTSRISPAAAPGKVEAPTTPANPTPQLGSPAPRERPSAGLQLRGGWLAARSEAASEAGEGGAAGGGAVQGRRAEGRRCRRRCRLLARGDTDAGSSRGGESQRLPAASPEPERSRSGSRGGCAGGGGAASSCWGNPAPAARRARGWARGARGAGDLSLQPLPASVHAINSPVLPPCL